MKTFLVAVLFFSMTAAADVVEKRGAAIAVDAKSVALSAILEHPTAFMNQPIVTQGVVSDVCRWAGCWMTVAPTAGSASMRVTFKGFSAARSFRGRTIRLSGRVKVIGNKPSFVAEGIEVTAQ